MARIVTHYELFEELGRGGMGVVQKARDLRLGRVVALKFLSLDRIHSNVARARFLLEGKALSSLSHPHIATVYEVDEDNGTPFLVLEYLPGGTLHQRLRTPENLVSVGELLNWSTQLAEALAHAHGRGVIHRDIKATNAMFDGEGRIKLTDFGLAKMHDATQLTEAERVVGTLAYMAPERLSGKECDHRTDLFSLGVLMYQTATRQLPFSADSPEATIFKILNEGPTPATQLRADLPRDFQAILDGLLAKDIEERYQRAADVVSDLHSLARGLPVITSRLISPRSSTVTMPVTALRRRRRRLVLAAVGAALVLAFGTAAVSPGNGVYRRAHSLFLPKQKNVAVLPFRNIGGEPSQQAFCDGLTETVTTALNKYGGLSVVPATDSRNLSSIDRARRDFGANLVISGSVHRRGNDVRLIISLIDAELNRQIDSETIDWPVSRLNELEDAVLAKLATLLNVVIAERPANFMAANGSLVPGAHDAYLRGRGLLYRYDRAGNLDLARETFERATLLDPHFALAYVGLAETQILRFRLRKEPDIILSAQLAAERAVQLNGRLGSAHVALGAAQASGQRYEEAVREFETALKLDPNDPEAYRELGDLYKEQDRLAQAEQVYQRAVAARSADWNVLNQLGRFYYDQHRYAESERAFRKVIDITPDNHWGYWNLGLALFGQDRAQEAEAAMRKSLALRPAAVGFSNLGAMLMMAGRYPEAREVMLKAEQLSAEAPNSFRLWGNLGDSHWLAHSAADKARAAWERAAQIAALQVGTPPNSDVLSILAKYQAKLGNAAEASARIEEALKQSPANGNVHFQAGLVFALLGQNDRALTELNEAASRGYALAEIRGAPELRLLRGDSRFQELTNRK